jgi:hypothetical protein
MEIPGMIEPQLFPYPSMPVRLEVTEENRVCWFRDDYDLQKHLTRYKLDKKKIKIFYRDGEPIQQRKTNKRSVESKSKSKNN